MLSDNLKIERLHDVGLFTSLGEDWLRLAGTNRMRSFAWATAWWRSFGKQLEPYVIVARQNDEVVGILPLALETTLLRGRRLVLIGSGKACGDDLGLLVDSTHSEEVAEAIADFLVAASAGDNWDSLDLDGLQPSNPATTVLLNGLDSVPGAITEHKPCPSCWTASIDKTWSDHLQSLSKRMRKIIRELEAKYLQSGRAILDVATTLDDAKRKLQIVADFHQSRWKSRNIDGCFASDGFGSFLEDLLSQWWSEGIAYVATLKLDGQDVAGTFGFWSEEELAIYLVGMDVAAQEHRPGWMLNIESMKNAIVQGKRNINFLRGDEEYKARLGAVASEQQRWVITPPRLFPKIRRSAIRRGIKVRDWFRNCSSEFERPATV